MLSAFDNKWQWLFVLLGVIFTVLAAAIFFLLVQHPEKIGITIDDVVISQKVEDNMHRLSNTSQTFVEKSQSNEDDALIDDARKNHKHLYNSALTASMDSDATKPLAK